MFGQQNIFAQQKDAVSSLTHFDFELVLSHTHSWLANIYQLSVAEATSYGLVYIGVSTHCNPSKEPPFFRQDLP